MENGYFDVTSDCSSELSETQSELEARIYSVVHHNDFSGTSVAPFIDPKYGVEFTPDGEVVVYLRDPADLVVDPVASPTAVCNTRVIPTIILDDDDDDDDDDVMECGKDTVTVVAEFVETSLKKKKKKKKKNLNDKSIQEYIDIVKTTNALEEYKEKSGFNKMNSKSSDAENVALNVSFRNERALPMTADEVLKQYTIGKPTESSLWYRCPKTWTPGMISYYTKIQKSKRNFDCGEEMRKVREKYGSNPNDWTLDPKDLYKSYSNTSKVRCNACRQFGHNAYNCKVPYKPEICIMCGMEGHNFHSCTNKICLSCGTWQYKFTNNCKICLSKSRAKCNMCNTVGHESKNCTESWRQFHSIISTSPERRSGEFAQSTSRFNIEEIQFTPRKASSAPSTPSVRELNNRSFRTEESGKSKKAKRLQRLRGKKKHHLRTKNHNNLTTSDHESINIDVNIQDVTLKRTLTKKNFFKKPKFSV